MHEKQMTDIALDSDTSFEKVAPGVYERHNDGSWLGFPGLFGGYVNALALQACAQEIASAQEIKGETRPPRTLTVHFLRPFPEGLMRVETNVERSGMSVTVVTARMFCQGKLCGFAAATFAREREAIDFTDLKMPKVAPFDPNQPKSGDLPFPFRDNLDMWDVFAGIPEGQKLYHSGGWARPANGKRIDEKFLATVADGFTPVAYRKLDAPMMAGTMEFTAYFRVNPKHLPIGTPVLVALTTGASLNGYVEEDSTIWTPDGDLLFQSRQFRFIQNNKTSKAEKALQDGGQLENFSLSKQGMEPPESKLMY